MSSQPAPRDWWKSAVVYQIYPRSFADANGDGMGDLRGIIGKLDYLQRLGVDVVWLSPIYRSPQDDNGYDIADYQDIDPMFGSLEDLDELIAGLHARGLKLVMDLVVNHTSDEHPWFVESRSSTDNPRRDWYWWRPAREGFAPGEPGAEPTNWMGFFSTPAWQLDPLTNEYYLHLFSVKQPDLNWENPEVRQAVYAMMRWWLDRGVDGFRMDVINLISKVASLPDGDPFPNSHYGNGMPFVMNGPRVHEFLHEMHEAVFAGREGAFITVGETPGATLEDAILYTDAAREEVDMIFQFEHVGLDNAGGDKWHPIPFDLVALKANLGKWQAGLAERGWNSLYWNNHDQPRVVSRFGDDSPEFRERSAKLLGGLLHLHRGTPYVYQGEELGMTNMAFASIDEMNDIEAKNYFRLATAVEGADPAEVFARMAPRNRDNARTPMQWDAGEGAGFTTGTPWLRVNPNHTEINAAAQVNDPDSVFAFYRRIIALRHEHPIVAHGDFTMLIPDDPHVYAFTRSLDGETWLVLGNFSREEQSPAIDAAWTDDGVERVIGNDADPAPGDGITLRPWELLVLRRTEA